MNIYIYFYPQMFPLDQAYQAPVAKMFFQHSTRCLGKGWLGDEPYRCVLVGRAQRQGFGPQARLGRRWGQWSRRRLGGWRGPSFFFVWKFLFADLTKVSGFLNMCFFTRMFFVKCEDIALVCHWKWNPRCEAFRTSKKVGSRHP